MIKLQVIGNLGKDCIVNQVNGKNVMNFNICHTEKFKDSTGTLKEKSTWVECAYWSDRVALAPYLKKGTQLFVEGTPEVRQYKKNDGSYGSSLSLRVMTVQLLGQKQNENGGNSTETQFRPPVNSTNAQPGENGFFNEPSPGEPVDDLPF